MENGNSNSELKIVVYPNGPYLVEGDINVTTIDGKTVKLSNPHLCRCGGSSKKPFCDGTHKKIGFTD